MLNRNFIPQVGTPHRTANEVKWDLRFLELAKLIASWSKDPSTKVGAVLVNRDRVIVGTGYNGFPKGVDDSPELYADRATKYSIILHAETNALLYASSQHLADCTLYTWPFQPCALCTSKLIQKGIRTCVAPAMSDDLRERWGENIALSEKLMAEAGVSLYIYDEVHQPRKRTLVQVAPITATKITEKSL